MTETDYTELLAQLQELRDRPPPQSPWGTRWMDRLGFLVSSTWFAVCFGLMFMAWPTAEERSKLKREQRRAQDRAALDAWETAFRAAWQANRTESAITPEWML